MNRHFIARNCSISDYDTTHSSLCSSPTAFLHEDFPDPSTPRSPEQNELDSPTPSRLKIVNKCKNCSSTFRVGSRNTEFCSKDCATCFTMFKRPTVAHSPQKTAEEIRKSIYQFQLQLARQEQMKAAVTTFGSEA